MKKVQNTLLVLAFFLFLSQNLANADNSPPALPTLTPTPPPLPVSTDAKVRTIDSRGSGKTLATITTSTEEQNALIKDREENIFLLESVLSHLSGEEPYANAIDPRSTKPEYTNPRIFDALTAINEFSQGKHNDIGQFLQTNYKTEYLPSEMYDKQNPHLAKPIYMSEVVKWAFDAIASGNLNLTRILLDNYIFLLTIKNDEGYGLLSYAILHGRNDIAYMLVYRGANLAEENKYQAQPINIAARTNNIEAVKLLLDNGCNADYQDAFGKSAMDYASMNDNKEMYNYLLSFRKD